MALDLTKILVTNTEGHAETQTADEQGWVYPNKLDAFNINYFKEILVALYTDLESVVPYYASQDQYEDKRGGIIRDTTLTYDLEKSLEDKESFLNFQSFIIAQTVDTTFLQEAFSQGTAKLIEEGMIEIPDGRGTKFTQALLVDNRFSPQEVQTTQQIKLCFETILKTQEELDEEQKALEIAEEQAVAQLDSPITNETVDDVTK